MVDPTDMTCVESSVLAQEAEDPTCTSHGGQECKSLRAMDFRQNFHERVTPVEVEVCVKLDLDDS